MLRIVLSTVLCLLVASTADAQFVRISARDFANSPARVAALRRAVQRMKDRNTASRTSATYRTSWQYWANTHGYFGTGPNSSGNATAFRNAAPQICAGLPQSQFNLCLTYYPHVVNTNLPADGISQNVWGMCQHSESSVPALANMQFLTWHRMYLKYFERTLRRFSGDPNFTLPYWDYFQETGPNNGIALPSLVRGTTGPLVDRFRTPGLNTNATSIARGTGSAQQAFDFTDFRSFSAVLEQQPHGAMHCGAGFGCQAPDMGIVPVAGLDPVFYMHHANIDRLFQCWLVRKAAGQPITLAWAKANLGMDDAFFNQRWHFVDENGAAVSMTVAELFQPGGIDYRYAQVTDCVPAGARPEVPETPAVARRAQAGSVSLRGRSLAVPLESAQEAPEAPLPEGIQVDPGRTLLLLNDVRVEGGNPGVTYEIYIARESAPNQRVYVSTINWFGILHGPHAQHRARRGHDLLFYDVTDELEELGNPSEEDLTVTFEPTHGTTETPSVGRRAGTVTVGSIRLQSVARR